MLDHYILNSTNFHIEFEINNEQFNLIYELFRTAVSYMTEDERLIFKKMITPSCILLDNINIEVLEKFVVHSQNNPQYQSNPMNENCRTMWNTLQNMTYLLKPYKNPRMINHISLEVMNDEDLPL